MENNLDDKKFDIIYKIVITGNVNVGKTTLFNYYNEHYPKKKSTTITSFLGKEPTTIVPCFGKKYISLDNKIILIHILDTCGMERYDSIAEGFYSNAKGAFVIYDITNRQSFNSVDKWINKLSGTKPIITILGNKCDSTNRIITADEGKKIADKHKAFFFETSCLNQTNLDQAFDNLVKSIYLKYKDDDDDDFTIIYKNDSFKIENENFMISNIKSNSEARKTDYELCC